MRVYNTDSSNDFFLFLDRSQFDKTQSWFPRHFCATLAIRFISSMWRLPGHSIAKKNVLNLPFISILQRRTFTKSNIRIRDHTFWARFWKRAHKVSGCFLGPFFSGPQGSGIPSGPVFIIIVITRKYEVALNFNQNFQHACDMTYRMVCFFKIFIEFNRLLFQSEV